MDYAEARKKVRAEKPQDAFMIIQLDGSDKLILPHKAGVALLDAMTSAEKFNDRWRTSNSRIVPLESGYIVSSSMERREYENYKIAALLNVSVDEVQRLEVPNLP
jgi:hypothetical protein